ncbi:MAG TPA: hypothetical protein VE222_06990, partial [Nitrospiraceae bacterium]|nr:hypothetical protein [Nitrospiraceae bacterium]
TRPTKRTKQTRETRSTRQIGLMRGAWWFWFEPGGVLEDALRAGVVDELLAADESLLHRQPAPGAEAIGQVGGGRSLVRFRWGDIGHVRHSLRPLRILSIDRVVPERLGVKKSFAIPSDVKSFVV